MHYGVLCGTKEDSCGTCVEYDNIKLIYSLLELLTLGMD